MKKEVAEGIVIAGQEAGEELDLHEGYSGRGMYGMETAAVHADSLRAFAVGLASYAYDLGGDDSDGCSYEQLEAAMLELAQDSMGLGIVLY